MDELLNFFSSNWKLYSDDEITFSKSCSLENRINSPSCPQPGSKVDEIIYIYKDAFILLGVVRFIDIRVIIDLEECKDDYLRSSLSYFLTRNISSTLIGTSILIAGTGNLY